MNGTVAELLEQEHDALLMVINQLLRLPHQEQSKRQMQLFDFYRQAAPQLGAERTVIYHALSLEHNTPPSLQRLLLEHEQLELELNKLQPSSPFSTDGCRELLAQLQLHLQNHFSREQKELFQIDSSLFSPANAERLQTAYFREKARVRNEIKQQTKHS
jgi:hemerythrin-like domain-containing protein